MDHDVWAKRGAKRKSRQVGPPVSTPLSRRASPLGSPVTANRVQASLVQQLAASTPSRRRSLPPLPPVPLSESLHQRWRERPRCPALSVTRGRRTGSFAPSLVVPGVTLCAAQFVRTKRAGRVFVFVVVFLQMQREPMSIRAWPATRAQVLQDARHALRPSCALLHRAVHAGAVLGVVNALRYASTRPAAGPAGIDNACARHTVGYYAMAGFLMARAKQKGRISLSDSQGGRASSQSTTELNPRAQSPAQSPIDSRVGQA